MVTTLNITLDDAVADEARAAKNELDLTWPEFIEWAVDQYQDEHAPRELTLESEPESDPGPEPELETPAESAPEPAPDPIESLDVPGSGTTAERRREMIRDMYEYLQREGTAQKSDFLELVDSAEVGYASPESFWSNVVKGRQALQGLSGVEAPGEGARTWRYTG